MRLTLGFITGASKAVGMWGLGFNAELRGVRVCLDLKSRQKHAKHAETKANSQLFSGPLKIKVPFRVNKETPK